MISAIPKGVKSDVHVHKFTGAVVFAQNQTIRFHSEPDVLVGDIWLRKYSEAPSNMRFAAIHSNWMGSFRPTNE